ncbi:MAG TPA: hypothetical protein DHV55_04930 [Clostridiaceae bacterium]|nr:hypothetical protein [Clostridiaceae bacterium]
MGVTVREILQSQYFSGYRILAGKEALDLKAQAVVLFDAPDGYKWFKGKEFVITSGYLFKDNTELFKEVIMHLFKHKSA